MTLKSMRRMRKSNKEDDLNRKAVFLFLLLDCPHLTHSALIIYVLDAHPA
jgi:hypothetical protein